MATVSETLAEAVAHHQAGRRDEAERLYRQILAADPDNVASLNNLALIAGGDEAVTLFEKALALQPDYPEARNNLGVVLQSLGRLDEAAGRYQRALALRPDYPDALMNLGIVRLIADQPGEAVPCFERLAALAPDREDVRRALCAALGQAGTALAEQGRHAEAVPCFERLTALRPGHSDSRNNLLVTLNRAGSTLAGQGRYAEAASYFERLAALEPDDPAILWLFADALKNLGRLDEAIELYRRALALRPDFPEALCDLGNTLQKLGRLDEAIELYRQARRLRPDYPKAHLLESFARLRGGDFEAGWRQYEWRWRYGDVQPHGHYCQPLWDGSWLDGRRILLHCEQAAGDAIQFIRYAGLVKEMGGTVVVLCPKPLARLFRSAAGIDQLVSDPTLLPPCDCQAPLLSLPMLLGTTLATIPAAAPYLRSEPDLMAAWRRRLVSSDGFKIGLVWSGGARDPRRNLRLDQFAPLAALPGIRFFSLQKGAPSEEGRRPPPGMALTDWSGELHDFAATAALIANLDMIISVDTSVAHLAGALGRPVWLPLPFDSEWRWLLERDDSPWYPTMRLFRQRAHGEWEPVFAAIVAVLGALIGGDRSVLAPGNRQGPGGLAGSPGAAGGGLEEERRRERAATAATNLKRWSNPNAFEAAWDIRARKAADLIPAGAAVLDLGCGGMALERFLPVVCRYVPCDLVRRDERTVICDFNAGTYPDAAAGEADIVSVLGVLEYLFDVRAFLSRLRRWNRPVVMSYCATDAAADPQRRRMLGWVNDLSVATLTDLLGELGFSVQRADRIDRVQWLFRLLPAWPQSRKMKRVAVLSYHNAGNFGDRLGYHLINGILPAHVEVSHLVFHPWVESDEKYDLSIIGLGNSLFGHLLNDKLIPLVERSHCSIGIFGTQYHETFPRSALDGFVGRLDHWYARYEDDLLRYGRGRNNVSHLGDWLITAFPMAVPETRVQLTVEPDDFEDAPLDRTIQTIQQHACVFSHRLHPLLCALTSAELVGYREQRELKGCEASGKFRAMLLDVFGRSFPEGDLWAVERRLVADYQAAVRERVEALRGHLSRLLS